LSRLLAKFDGDEGMNARIKVLKLAKIFDNQQGLEVMEGSGGGGDDGGQ
jgi:hypothetical protein